MVNASLTVAPGGKVICDEAAVILSVGEDATARVEKASVRLRPIKTSNIRFERFKKEVRWLNKTDRQVKKLPEQLARLMPFELTYVIVDCLN